MVLGSFRKCSVVNGILLNLKLMVKSKRRNLDNLEKWKNKTMNNNEQILFI